MNWRDFLLLAVRLASGAAEADWRTGVSRAYYAAFHVARRLFTDLNFIVPRADRAHQYCVFRLSNSGEASVEQAGRDLDTLRRLRNRADYDDAPPRKRRLSPPLSLLKPLSNNSMLLGKTRPAPISGTR